MISMHLCRWLLCVLLFDLALAQLPGKRVWRQPVQIGLKELYPDELWMTKLQHDQASAREDAERTAHRRRQSKAQRIMETIKKGIKGDLMKEQNETFLHDSREKTHLKEGGTAALWACEVESRPEDEGNHNFLFQAVIRDDGIATPVVTEVDGEDFNQIVFQKFMYDIQHDFNSVYQKNGRLNMKIKFAARCRKSADGWFIEFNGLRLSSQGHKHWEGEASTSWWGQRLVNLTRFDLLSSSEKRKYPTLSEKKYVRSMPEPKEIFA